MEETALGFSWSDPTPGDRWNFTYDGACVSVGTIGLGQVVARIYRRRSTDDLFASEEFWGVLVRNETSGGQSTSNAGGGLTSREVAEEFVEDHLFGALRDWYRCRTCGCLTGDGWHQLDGLRLRSEQSCHECDFWRRVVAQRAASPGIFAVVKGCVYQVGPEPAPGSERSGLGHGGRRFEIVWRDGRRVVTTNLWHRGQVSPAFRCVFPDDADFA